MLGRRDITYVIVGLMAFLLVAAGWEQRPVRQIRIEGNRKIEDQAILYKLKTKIGEPYSPEKIEEDLLKVTNGSSSYSLLRATAKTITTKGKIVAIDGNNISSARVLRGHSGIGGIALTLKNIKVQ